MINLLIKIIKWFNYCRLCGGLWGSHNKLTHLGAELGFYDKQTP